MFGLFKRKQANTISYYRILFDEEHARKNCRYGILNGQVSEFETGEIIPHDYEEKGKLFFEGSKNKILIDFQMAYQDVKLVSQKFRDVLVKFINEDVVIYPIKVIREKEEFTYYNVHFNRKYKVLGKQRGPEELLRPKLNMSKVNRLNLHVFCYEEFDPSTFCISEIVKKELEVNQITGCSYQLISD